MAVKILLFYKFVELANLEQWKESHLKFLRESNIFGRVIFSKEGINGSVAGTDEQMENYKRYLLGFEEFKDISFKEENGIASPFTRRKVLIKPEIVTLRTAVDLNRRGNYITPSELVELYDADEEFVIIDTRNDYEYEVGRFKNALKSGIKKFSEFPYALENFEKYKDKKVIIYCTGGIRCEKASALMIQEGFKNVYQLKEGIINFYQEKPNTFWEGKCFVFDLRMQTEDSKEKSLTYCKLCTASCDLYRNCRNPKCDELVVICRTCNEKKQGCCSDVCFEEYKEYCKQKSLNAQGKLILQLINGKENSNFLAP